MPHWRMGLYWVKTWIKPKLPVRWFSLVPLIFPCSWALLTWTWPSLQDPAAPRGGVYWRAMTPKTPDRTIPFWRCGSVGMHSFTILLGIQWKRFLESLQWQQQCFCTFESFTLSHTRVLDFCQILLKYIPALLVVLRRVISVCVCTRRHSPPCWAYGTDGRVECPDGNCCTCLSLCSFKCLSPGKVFSMYRFFLGYSGLTFRKALPGQPPF